MRKSEAREMLDSAYIKDLLPDHIYDMVVKLHAGESYDEVTEFHMDWLAEMLDDESEEEWVKPEEDV